MKTIKKQLKRAFTIVELVIVIAVVAALAAILIPTFVNVVNSANESVDTALAKNLDTSLVTIENKLSKNNGVYNVTEALTLVRNDGYDVSKLTPTSDNSDYVYNASTNRFLFYTDNFSNLAYGEEPDTDDTLIVITDGNLSRYSEATSNGNLLSAYDNLEYCVYSLDAVSISTTSTATIWLYTESGTTTIDAGNAVVYHYGSGDYTYISSIAGDSYHLYGILNMLYALSGHIDTTNGTVDSVYIPSASQSNVKVDIDESATKLYTDKDDIKFDSKDTSSKYDAANINESDISSDVSSAISAIIETVSESYTITNTVSATCTTDGSITYTSADGSSTTVVVPATGHIGEGSLSSVTPVISDNVLYVDCEYSATCTECSTSFTKTETVKLSEALNDQEVLTTIYNDGNESYTAGDDSVELEFEINVEYSNASNSYYCGSVTLKTYSGSSTDIIVPDGITKIVAFEVYSHIIYLEEPESTSTITSIVISDTVTTIGTQAFYNCTTLESVVIGNGVTEIGMCAFMSCTSLKSIIIGNSVEYIDDFAFAACTSLESITIPSSVKYIGDDAFFTCTSLKSITLSEGLISFADEVFWNCTALTSIVIPKSVTTLGKNIFYGCSSLVSVTFEEASGWYVTTSSEYTGGSVVGVTNAATNAKYFISSTYYRGYYWYKA